MKRALLVALSALVLSVATTAQTPASRRQAAKPAAVAPAPFSIVEATIPEMRAAMEQGRVTSHELVVQSLDADRALRRDAQCGHDDQPRTRWPRPMRATANAGTARCAGRCTGSRSRSRTTSTPPTCRPRAARSPFEGLVPPYEATLDQEPARRRRHHHRQDRHDRAGQLGGRRPHADAGQLQRARRLRHEPVRPAAAIRARRPPTGGRARHRRIELRASAPPPVSGQPTSAPRRQGRS